MTTDHDCECCYKNKATHHVWCREDVTPTSPTHAAWLDYLCDECFASELARNVVVSLAAGKPDTSGEATCCYRFPTCEVLGTRLRDGAAVTLARLGEYESWTPAQALAVAAAIVAAATFAAKKPQPSDPGR